MSRVTIKLRDPGASVSNKEFSLTGTESKVVNETELVTSLRKKGILVTEPFVEPKQVKPEGKNPEKDPTK